MKTIAPRISLIFIAIAFIVAGCERAPDDILDLMPDQTRLDFENNYVRVLHVTLEPGDAQPLHECGNRFIYAMSNYTINYYQPHDTIQISWNKGGVHWHERGMHAVENVGETVAEYYMIERTRKPLPRVDQQLYELDPALMETGFVTEIFENNHARVLRVELPPGKNIPDHSGTHRLVFSLSDYRIRYSSETEQTVDKSYARGDFHWHPAGSHTVENIGDTDAEFVIFSYRQ